MLGMAGAGTEGSTAPRRRAGPRWERGTPPCRRREPVPHHRDLVLRWGRAPLLLGELPGTGGGLHRPERLGTSWYSGVRG